MSEESPRFPAIPPRWMPIGDDPEVCPIGEWWDVVRVAEGIGYRAIDLLRTGGETIGPVVLGDEGTSLRVYFLMPVGTASAWQVPGTVPLGVRNHLVVPPVTAVEPPGLHWLVLPAGPRLLTHPATLRRAIGRARRERGAGTGTEES
ncbi:hypothetical protein OHU11_28415 [Streptomyces sp. NBC_00257]|uniref:hypothetical protein n=1 Tax=unclassified Streptomyces TaxID=2593676 RepID=UPI0022567B32|nr:MULTISPECIES: hypothetical protein [unclassified Streptomyces]MCX5431578.1 hypothetical protein [Streptomyces sp. NBC_00062]